MRDGIKLRPLTRSDDLASGLAVFLERQVERHVAKYFITPAKNVDQEDAQVLR